MDNHVDLIEIKEYRPWTPISFTWANHSSWGWHGIEMGSVRCPPQMHSYGMMPGYQKMVTRVFSLWRLRIVFGPSNVNFERMEKQ